MVKSLRRALLVAVLAVIAFAALAVGCVTTAEPRLTPTEAAAGPPPIPAEQRSALHVVERIPRSLSTHASALPERPRTTDPLLLAAGYWHWDGVAWRFVEPRWERAHPAWTW